jgi:hypothetical protein
MEDAMADVAQDTDMKTEPAHPNYGYTMPRNVPEMFPRTGRC